MRRTVRPEVDMSERSNALGVAKQGFQCAMRRAQYKGMIGRNYYEMDRDDWRMRVINERGDEFWFPIAKSWEA